MLDLQRPRGGLLQRLRPYDRGRGRARRDRVPRPRRPAGADRDRPGHALAASHRRTDLRRHSRDQGRCARRDRRRLPRRHEHAQSLPPERRRFRRRHGPGGAGCGHRPHRPPHRLRRPAQGPPVRRPPGRRDGHPYGSRPAARPRGGRRVRRRGRRCAEAVRDGEAPGDRDRPVRRGRRGPAAWRPCAPARPLAGASVPGGARPADLRGRNGGPAHDHRQGAVQGAVAKESHASSHATAEEPNA